MGGRPLKSVRAGTLCIAVVFLLAILSAGSFAAEKGAATPQPRLERMSFMDAPVGYILQSLGRMYNVNFSISSGASAKRVSIEINDASFREAIDVVCAAAGIVVTEVRESLFVAQTKEESISGVSEQEKEETRKEDRFTNMLMESVSVKYVDVVDVESSISKLLGEEAGAMVRVSKTATDEKRNYGSVLITAPNARLMNAVKKIITEIDRPVPMVEISILFVEITKSKNSATGIDWDISQTFSFEEDFPGPTNSFFQFGKFQRTTGAGFSAAIGALVGDGKSRVLADPKIKVVSGRKANFGSETQVPILSRNSDGDITTEYKNVGITLDILPAVLDDGTIHMKVEPKASSITGEKRLGDVVAPVISERKAETEVLMRSGETMVIGGLMNDKEIRTLSQLPFLSKLPLFGPLFQSERLENETSTVVIFIRPRTIEVAPLEKGTPSGVEALFSADAERRSKARSEESARIELMKAAEAVGAKTPEQKENFSAKRTELVPVPTPAPKASMNTVPSVSTENAAPQTGRKWETVGDIDQYLLGLASQYGIEGEALPIAEPSTNQVPYPQTPDTLPEVNVVPAPIVWTPPTE